MAFLNSAQWARYKSVINEVAEDFNKDLILWKKFSYGFSRQGEDVPTDKKYTDINLECLIAYNYFRTWPSTKDTPAGELDKQNMVVIFNMEYLRNLGYVNTDNNFDFDPGKDKFVHQGLVYEDAGHTAMAQANDEPLLYQIILKRTPTETGNKPL